MLSLGIMQKTVDSQGSGELPRQLREFRDQNAQTAAIFQRELGSKGYSVAPKIIKTKKGPPKLDPTTDVLYFTDPTVKDASAITGKELFNLIRHNSNRWHELLNPFRMLARTPEFQTKQVLDFNQRLVDALKVKPAGYHHRIGQFVTSQYGSALVLDQSVNRPAFVLKDFGKALNKFYEKNSNVSKDPLSWNAAHRVVYENQIVEQYIKIRRGTDMLERAQHLANTGLSTVPHSLKLP